jgi:hypothetical protein
MFYLEPIPLGTRLGLALAALSRSGERVPSCSVSKKTARAPRPPRFLGFTLSPRRGHRIGNFRRRQQPNTGILIKPYFATRAIAINGKEKQNHLALLAAPGVLAIKKPLHPPRPYWDRLLEPLLKRCARADAHRRAVSGRGGRCSHARCGKPCRLEKNHATL